LLSRNCGLFTPFQAGSRQIAPLQDPKRRCRIGGPGIFHKTHQSQEPQCQPVVLPRNRCVRLTRPSSSRHKTAQASLRSSLIKLVIRAGSPLAIKRVHDDSNEVANGTAEQKRMGQSAGVATFPHGLGRTRISAGSFASAPDPVTVKRQVLVSIPDRKMVVIENGFVIRTFAVSVGAAASPSPTGKFEIVNRLAAPTYYHAGVVIPPGGRNPLGPRWVGLNKKGYGIHGTNVPGSVGRAASHGCIRLRNRDIVEFANLVNVGDSVEIRGERDQEIARMFGRDPSAPFAIRADARACFNCEQRSVDVHQSS